MKLFKKTPQLFSIVSVGIAPLVVSLSCSPSEKDNKGSEKDNKGVADAKSPLGYFKDTSKDTSKYEDLNGIKGQGSSSVLPIIEEIGKILKNMEYEETGSGDGLKVGLALGGNTSDGITGKDFGMTSSLKRPENVYDWKDVRTVTYAIDAIGIAINLPNGVKIKNNEKPIINIQELAKLYDNENDTTTTWKNLLENEDASSTHLEESPIPLGRKGGKGASGTADGFWHILGKNLPEGSTADKNHEHLSENGGETTAEANSVALNVLKQKEGSITYLSLGLSLEDQDANKEDGFWLASIKKDAETWVPSLENAKEGSYKWRRPFNVIYSVKNEKAIKFVQFLLQTEVSKIITDKGFVPLTKDQLKKQFGTVKLDKVKEDLKKPDTEKITSQEGKTVVDGILGLEI